LLQVFLQLPQGQALESVHQQAVAHQQSVVVPAKALVMVEWEHHYLQVH